MKTEKEKKLKCLKELNQSVASLYHMVEDESLDGDMNAAMPFIIESQFSEIAKMLNYESTLTKMKEERARELRAAYETISKLEGQLAMSNETSGISETIRSLVEEVEDWWKTEGFNYISKPSFSSMGSLFCKLCFMLSSEDDENGNHFQSLQDEGFIFCKGMGRDYEKKLLDCDINRELLKKMIKKRFPTSKVIEWNSRVISKSKTDESAINEVHIVIYDLCEIRK